MGKELATTKKHTAALSKRHQSALEKVAALEGIPTSGLTILGGKPYVNVTGLDVKLRAKCEAEKLVHIGTEYEIITPATKENGMHASGWGIVRLFDKIGFEKALTIISKQKPPSKEAIELLASLSTHTFKMRGFASPETLQMKSMQALDNVEHMAERRATNRAKREATGTGLTSLEEMLLDDSIESDDSLISTGDDEMPKWRKIILAEFGRIGITADLVFDHFKIKAIDEMTLDMVKEGKRIFNEISVDAKMLLQYFPKAEKTETERERASAKDAVDQMMAKNGKDRKSEKKEPEKAKPERKASDEMPTPEQGAEYLKLEALIKKASTKEKLNELSERVADSYASKKLIVGQAKPLSDFIERRKAAMK